MFSLTERGIWTTTATHWLHYFPVEKMMYLVAVEAVRDWINCDSPRKIPGKSNNGHVTGEGHCFPKIFNCIEKFSFVPPTEENWLDGTDRQNGIERGEYHALIFLRSRFGDPVMDYRNDPVMQLAGIDFGRIHNREPCFIDVKTETPTVRGHPPGTSPNLFIQTAEGHHDPCCRPNGDKLYTPINALLGFGC